MPFQTDLLPALKDWGLNVIEVNGWRTHGSSSFNPGGSVNHHTAGSTSNSIPSLNILRNGRSDLPGPLCNVAQSRSSNFNGAAKYDDVYLIAAGRANHAGSGGWRGLTGNSSVFGLEIEHCGYLEREGFSERRAHTAHRIHRAFIDAGGFKAEMICQHKEWAPSRKIDFVGANGSAFRSAVIATTNTTQPTPEEVIMFKAGTNIENIVKDCYQKIVGRAPESQAVLDTWHWSLAVSQGEGYAGMVNGLHYERRLREDAKFQALTDRIAKAETITPGSTIELTPEVEQQILAKVYADLTGRIKP